MSYPFIADHLAHVHHHHNISPEELAALECVLELITTLSEHVSIIFWAILAILFALFSGHNSVIEELMIAFVSFSMLLTELGIRFEILKSLDCVFFISFSFLHIYTA